MPPRETEAKRTASIDLHCDTLLRIYKSGDGASLDKNDFHLDLHKMESGGINTQFFAVFVPPGEKEPLQMCLDMIDRFYIELDRCSDKLAFAGSAFDIEKNRISGKKSAFLALEDSGTIGSKLSNLRLLHRLGVRLVTLTWNHRNPAGSPNIDPVTSSEGLTELGFEFVHEMKRLGMMVDVSHLSDAGFWDVSRTLDVPFVASHSNAREITYHHRNLTDDMIRSIAEHGGIIGINFYAPFLSTLRYNKSADNYDNGDSGTDKATYNNGDLFSGSTPKSATIDDVVQHINHFVKVGGIDCVALGSDFDGIDVPAIGLENGSRLPSLFEELEKAGYSSGDLEKFSYRNAYRVIQEVCG